MTDIITRLRRDLDQLTGALELIAAGLPDSGYWLHNREDCRQIALSALHRLHRLRREGTE